MRAGSLNIYFMFRYIKVRQNIRELRKMTMDKQWTITGFVDFGHQLLWACQFVG